jgi:hypothetical protein
MLIPKPSCRIPPSFPSTFHRMPQRYKALLFAGAVILAARNERHLRGNDLGNTQKSVVNGRFRSPKAVR